MAITLGNDNTITFTNVQAENFTYSLLMLLSLTYLLASGDNYT